MSKKRDSATAGKCVRTKILDHPVILCFHGEEIPLNKSAKRFLAHRPKARKGKK